MAINKSIELKMRQEVSISSLLLLATMTKIWYGLKKNRNDHIVVQVSPENWNQYIKMCHALSEKNVKFNTEIYQSSKSVRWVIHIGWNSGNSFILIVPFEIQNESIKPSLASSFNPTIEHYVVRAKTLIQE